MYIVYRHISPSNKVYIGITSKSAKVRWKNGYQRHQPLFWNAILKYGWDNFKHEVIFKDLTEKEAKLIEIDLIYYYKKIGKSYNITDGGDGTKGRLNSEYARQLISKAQNKKSVEQYDLNGNLVCVYDSITDASKAIGKAVYRNNHWIPARGISKSCKTGCVAYNFKWKLVTDKELIVKEYKNKKEIVQLTLDEKFLEKFSSEREAEEKTGICHKLISACCTGKRKSTKGYKWMYYSKYAATCMNLPQDPINIKYDYSDKSKEIS